MEDSTSTSTPQPQPQTQTQQPHQQADSDSDSDLVAADSFSDEGYAASSNSTFLTSLASSVLRGVDENGRLYPSYGRHEYGMPMDEQELDRNDLQHAKFKLLLEGRLYVSAIPQPPSRVLDVGTGTGIWSIEMGDLYPEAEITGTDIAATQPRWVPPNVQFLVEDAESEWELPGGGGFDLVFGRELTFAVRDWVRFVGQAMAALKPGGWLELAATYPRTHCDDGSLDLGTSVFVETVEIYFEIAEAMGCSLENARRWRGLMEEAGFVDVQEQWFKMPMGPWAKDKRYKQIGHFELAQLNAGYEAYMMRGWTQVLQRPPEQLHALIAGGRKEINNPRHHTYAHFIVVTGRKPES